MTARQLEGRLKEFNHAFRLVNGPAHVSGLYLYLPRHPMSNPANGLKHLGGIPSPRVLWNIPKRSLTINGIKHPSITQIVQRIVGKRLEGHGRVLSKGAAWSLFGVKA